MAWGKEEFRTKYKESNDCLEKIKDNYYDLDYEYQMISKQLQQKENIIKEVREFAKLRKEMYERQENVVGQEVIISLLNILDKGE